MTEEHRQNIQKWELLIKGRLDSGVSVSKFCETNGYSEKMYYYWVSEIHKVDPDFRTSSAPGRTKIEKASTLVEISPAVPEKSESHMVPDAETRIPMAAIHSGCVRIELYPNADAAFMRDLLESVRYVQA